MTEETIVHATLLESVINAFAGGRFVTVPEPEVQMGRTRIFQSATNREIHRSLQATLQSRQLLLRHISFLSHCLDDGIHGHLYEKMRIKTTTMMGEQRARTARNPTAP